MSGFVQPYLHAVEIQIWKIEDNKCSAEKKWGYIGSTVYEKQYVKTAVCPNS